MVLTTQAFNADLDLGPSIGQRQATFRFDLVDGVTDQVLGQVTPLKDSPPTLTHDTSRSVKRSIDQIIFGAADAAAIDPIRDRIRLYFVLSGTAYPLGRFVFTNATNTVTTGGNLDNCVLVDEMFLIDQELSAGFSYVGSCDQAARALLGLVGVKPPAVNIEPTGYPAVGAWAVGTRGGQVLDALSIQGDYLSPWMGNDGSFRMVRTIDQGTAVPTFDFDANAKVVRSTITSTSDLLSAPNRFIVISNNGAATPAVGRYDVPATAPHSIQNRGFVIADVENLQVSSPQQAQAAATNLGLRRTIIERTQLTTPPDPRHDSYDVIRWLGDNWLEIAWSMSLVEGGAMVHTMRKAYR